MHANHARERGRVRGPHVRYDHTRAGLLRTRKQLVREKTSHVQRIQKTLEDANIKIASAISNIMGTTGRAMLEAIVAGESDPTKLAALAHPRIAAAPDELREALRGRITKHHRFLLRLHLGQVDALDASIAAIDEEVGLGLEPFRRAIDILKTIPGVSDLAAQVIVSEIGTDMSRFPTAGHLVSWAGLCPRNDESVGKRRSTRIRHGAPWLKTLLVQCAWGAATRKKDGYLRAQYLRIRSRRGTKKAIVAVAASILSAAYYMLRDQVPWRDLGTDYFNRLNRERVANRLVRRLSELGYKVELKSAA